MPSPQHPDHSLRGSLILACLIVFVFAGVACQAEPLGGLEADEPARASRLPSPGLASCIQGVWEMAEPEAYFRSLMLSGAQGELDPEMEQFEVKVSGTATQHFFPDGRFEVRYDTTLTFSMGDGEAAWSTRMVGTGHSTWEVQDELLRGGPSDMSDVKMAMQIGGGEFSELEPLPDDFASEERELGSVARVECRGNTMTLEMIEPIPLPPAELRRVR